MLFTAGSALCGLASSAPELILFRVLQGVGGGMILPIGQMMMAEAAGPKRMGRVMSLVAVPAMLAPILGPTVGGLIIDDLHLWGIASWHWLFFVNVPIGVIAVIAGIRVLPHVAPKTTEHLDYLGLALLVVGVPAIVYGLAEIGETNSFTSIKVIAPIIAGAGPGRCCSCSMRCTPGGRCSTSGSTRSRRSRRRRSRCSLSRRRCSAA